MKKYLLALAFLFPLQSFSQNILYVTSKKDKRLIAYQDSLYNYKEYIRKYNAAKTVLEPITDYEKFLAAKDSLGYGAPISGRGKTYNPTTLVREVSANQEEILALKKQFDLADYSVIMYVWIDKHSYPKNKVVYRPQTKPKATLVSKKKEDREKYMTYAWYTNDRLDSMRRFKIIETNVHAR